MNKVTILLRGYSGNVLITCTGVKGQIPTVDVSTVGNDFDSPVNLGLPNDWNARRSVRLRIGAVFGEEVADSTIDAINAAIASLNSS